LLDVEGDVTHLPPDLGEFDLVGSLRTLHHVRRTELAFAELPRVTRPGGLVLVVDQVAPADRSWRSSSTASSAPATRRISARWPTPTSATSWRRTSSAACAPTSCSRLATSSAYLDLAACEGEERERARALAPDASFPVTVGWYLLRR
jgi:SAM-dependent methyltransferase